MASFGHLVQRNDRLDLGPRRPSDLLEFLSTQHVTQWSICELLAKLGSDPYRPGASQEAAAVLDYLTERLPVHVATEEQNLHALLKRREIPGDDVDGMFDILRAGHHDSRVLVEELVEGLHHIVIGRRLRDPSAFTSTAHAFCHHQRALIEWEDTVLFTYAHQRLDVQDLFDAHASNDHKFNVFGPMSERAEAAMERYMSSAHAIDLNAASSRRQIRRRQ